MAQPKRTTIYLDQELKKRMMIHCVHNNCTITSFIQEAVVEKLAKEGRPQKEEKEHEDN